MIGGSSRPGLSLTPLPPSAIAAIEHLIAAATSWVESASACLSV